MYHKTMYKHYLKNIRIRPEIEVKDIPTIINIFGIVVSTPIQYL